MRNFRLVVVMVAAGVLTACVSAPAPESGGGVQLGAIFDFLGEMVETMSGHAAVLRNACLLYRRDHGEWPTELSDVEEYIAARPVYTLVNFTTKPDGSLHVEWKSDRGDGSFDLNPARPRAPEVPPVPVNPSV